MANMVASQVTILKTWTEGDGTGKRRKAYRVTLATSNDGTGQGSATNAIPASLFNMTVIEEVTLGVTDGNVLIVAAPAYDGSSVLLYDVQNATDANRDNPADFINTTLRLTVKGY